MPGENIFLSIIEINMIVRQEPEGIPISFFQPVDALPDRFQAAESPAAGTRPYTLYGIDHQDAAYRIRIGHKHIDPGKIIFQVPVFRIPCALEKDAGRIIPFSLPFHRIPGKMGAAKVDAEQRLPVADLLIILQIHLPAGAPVQLGKHPFFIQLPRHRGYLLYNPPAIVFLGQHIHSRIIHIFIEAHQGALHHGLGRQAVFMEDMAGKQQLILMAPVLDWLRKIFKKQFLA